MPAKTAKTKEPTIKQKILDMITKINDLIDECETIRTGSEIIDTPLDAAGKQFTVAITNLSAIVTAADAFEGGLESPRD